MMQSQMETLQFIADFIDMHALVCVASQRLRDMLIFIARPPFVVRLLSRQPHPV